MKHARERREMHTKRHGASSGCGWKEGLQIRRVAANILNKQLRTADKG